MEENRRNLEELENEPNGPNGRMVSTAENFTKMDAQFVESNP